MSHRSRISVPSHEVTMRCPSKNRPLQCSTSLNISGCGICLQKMEKLCVHNTRKISGLAEDLFDCQSRRCHGSVFEKYFILQYDAASLGIRFSASSSKRRKPLFHWRRAISRKNKVISYWLFEKNFLPCSWLIYNSYPLSKSSLKSRFYYINLQTIGVFI